MKYNDYKRQIKLSKILNKPLEGDYMIMYKIMSKLLKLDEVCEDGCVKFYTKKGIHMLSISEKLAKFSFYYIHFPIMTRIVTMEDDDVKEFVRSFINDNFDRKFSIYSVITFNNVERDDESMNYEGWI
jgi:hypothetical protein